MLKKVFGLLLFPLFLSAAPNQIQLIKSEFISPALERYDCHSPTLIELDNNELLAAWFGGFGEGKCDYPDFTDAVGIWLSHYEAGMWSHPELIVSHPKTKCWNPVLHRLSNQELVLFYKVGDHPRAWYGALKRSSDNGKTWSEEELLPSGILGPIKNKILVSPEGYLLCGSSVESGDNANPFQATSCWIEIASPDLKKWEKYGPIEIPNQRFGAIQPTLYYGDDGLLHLMCRDRAHRIGKTGFIWQATSADNGKTWSSLSKTKLPNPDSGIDTLKLHNQVLLAYNPSHINRFPLAIALSEDNGVSWPHFFTLDPEQSEYPYLISTQNDLVHIVYSHSSRDGEARRIKHIVFCII